MKSTCWWIPIKVCTHICISWFACIWRHFQGCFGAFFCCSVCVHADVLSWSRPVLAVLSICRHSGPSPIEATGDLRQRWRGGKCGKTCLLAVKKTDDTARKNLHSLRKLNISFQKPFFTPASTGLGSLGLHMHIICIHV